VKDFFDLCWVQIVLVVKTMPRLFSMIIGCSLFLSSLSWFVLDVVFGLNISFTFLLKWIFAVLVLVLLFLDFAITLIVSFKLMKKFETTPEKITKAILDFDLLRKQNKAIMKGDAASFDLWYSECELNRHCRILIKNSIAKVIKNDRY